MEKHPLDLLADFVRAGGEYEQRFTALNAAWKDEVAMKLLPPQVRESLDRLAALANWFDGVDPEVFAALARRMDGMEKALEWYADRLNYESSRRYADDYPVLDDEGSRARAALASSGSAAEGGES